MNDCAPEAVSFTFRPTNVTSGWIADPSARSGASDRHGKHHDAQTLTTAGDRVAISSSNSPWVTGVGASGTGPSTACAQAVMVTPTANTTTAVRIRESGVLRTSGFEFPRNGGSVDLSAFEEGHEVVQQVGGLFDDP